MRPPQKTKRTLPTAAACIGAIVAFCGVDGLSQAAELSPMDAPPRTVTPGWEQPWPHYFTWTGAYIGMQGGGAFGDYYEAANSPFLPAIAGVPGVPGYFAAPHSASGPFGGGHIGFNYQFGQWVAGLEGDLEGGDVHFYSFASGAGFGPYSVETYNNLRASFRGRFGYALGHTLLYATAGGAWANFQTTHNYLLNPNPNSNYPGTPVLPSDQFSYAPLGWAVGAGVEYAFMGNLSARLEYRYADFGTTTIASPSPGLFYAERATEHSVRAGISYRFWAPAPTAPPIVAKY